MQTTEVTQATVPLSVIIPTTRPRLVREMLRTLTAADPQPAQILLIDDASAQDARKYVEEFPTVSLHRLERRSGPACARNLGASLASESVLVFLDDDVLIQPDTFSVIASHFEDSGVEALTGLFTRNPIYVNFFSIYKNDYMFFICDQAPALTSTLLTAICAIRAEPFELAGRFDEKIVAATIEDIDMGRRLSADGPSVRFDSGLQVTHMKHYSLRTLISSHFRRSRDMARYLLGKFPFGAFGELFSSQDRLALPWHFSLGVLLAGLFLLSPALYWLIPAQQAALGQILPFLLVGLTNLPFFRFVRKERGSWFALRCWPTLFLEFLISVLAIGWTFLTPLRTMRSS